MSDLIVSWNSSGSGFTRQAFPPLKHVRFPLATPGTEACDAMGGAFRPQWRELPAIVLRLSLQCCPKPVQDRCQARRSLPTSRHERYLSHVPIWITVAVGTTIADRPPHRSVQARLRIRLLSWMSGGKAGVRIRTQNAGLRNPPVQERDETIPSHLGALTATD